ncbi:MAG: histidinol dehydrogenase [Verrucomicrobiae bacterium]|nr:histidinol dehydrogenase [Verrucomicrobiae bacterium]
MRVISYQQKNFASALKKLDRRSQPLERVEKTVTEVVGAVRDQGDKALLAYAEKFDGVKFRSGKALRVTEAELDAADAATDAKTKRAIAASRKNVTAFAKKSLRKNWSDRNPQGAEVGEVFQPFERVGLYVPGGTAPLVSSANMTVALAKAAGCPEIVVCTPPQKDGSVNPALLHALRAAGATEIYKVGGAQAIAAMAIGTRTIAPVVKVFGPGNSYVVEAKRQMFGLVAVDLLPGPSEIVVMADDSARPEFIAADLLAQAEHGGDSEIGFVTDSPKLIEAVEREIEIQSATLSRQGPLRQVIEDRCWLVLVEKIEDGVDIVNGFAPEHLSLVSRKEKSLAPKIRTAGAIFLGNWSPVAVGDFLAGPSHELPTGGAGKSFPGLTVDQFQRRTSIVKLDRESIAKSAPIVEAFAKVEGLDAHGNSASIRVRR